MPSGGARIGAGKKKGTLHAATINRQLILEETRKYLASRVHEVNKAWVDKAANGDAPLIREFNDRLFDKSPQSTDLTTNGKDLPPSIINIVVPNVENADVQTDEKTV